MNDYVLTFQNKRTKLPTIVQDKDNGLLKFIIAYLFANASTLDFTNPIPFIDRNINFLLDDNLDALKDGISIGPLSNFQNSYLYIKLDEQSPFMETPYKIDISLIKKENNQLLKYHLPSVGYGISSNTAYIFFLENPKHKNIVKSEEQIKDEKKIKRELYKINALVNEQETMEYMLVIIMKVIIQKTFLMFHLQQFYLLLFSLIYFFKNGISNIKILIIYQ